MKKLLKNIVNSAKEVGKRAIASVLIPLMFYVPVRAADIDVWNWTNGEPTSNLISIMTGSSYNETHLFGEDGELIEGPPPELQIYSDPNRIKTGLDKRPENTPGVDMRLKVKGRISGQPIDNSLWFKVNDVNGLEHRNVVAYDVNNPSVIYDINTTVGEWTTIDLPDIKNKEDEVYATWHIATPPIVSGDCGSAAGPGILDGVKDIYDVATVCGGWLEETLEGENYLFGDLNYDGINDFRDYSIATNNND